MEIIWMVGGKGKAYCYLEACCAYIRPAVWALPDGTGRTPILEVSYKLDELVPVSAILREMQNGKIVPELYIWDEHKKEPEVLVMFRVPRPSTELLDEVIGAESALLLERTGGLSCDEVFTAGEANIKRQTVQFFLSEFAVQKQIIVAITDATEADTDSLHPIKTFTISSIIRRKPLLRF